MENEVNISKNNRDVSFKFENCPAMGTNDL